MDTRRIGTHFGHGFGKSVLKEHLDSAAFFNRTWDAAYAALAEVRKMLGGFCVILPAAFENLPSLTV